MSALKSFLMFGLALFVAFAHNVGMAQAIAGNTPDMAVGQVRGAAVNVVGPGDALRIVVLGHPDLTTDVTVTASGQITVPFLGSLDVNNQAPADIAQRVANGMRKGGYLRDPQVVVEVVQVRSRLASIYGEVQRPGRYPIEGNLSLLELLSLAGGVKAGADDKAVLMRREGTLGQPREQLEVTVGNRVVPSQDVQDIELQPGDVVFVPLAPRFYIYGEVGQPGAYPVEDGLNIMRAIALAGGLNARASENRILIRRVDPITGQMRDIPVELADAVLPGDVVYVNERWF
ncbi:SLBB domain-containing protein [Pusillimonas sp. NJUB218]|uniref:SLBB domain-containing protein n=1 Tax=Pusillimonas sp. NJUB218 TaxID=2023230 RepID=UPI000F4CD82F|nr:SLBB domain-containing protein [Pusillimonas sp. NJUB218]